LEQAKQAGFDLVVLDTAPHSDSAAAFAAEVADFVLIPCRPARFDMDAIPSTVHLADLTNTPTAVVLNAAPRGKIVDEARETLEALGIDVLPTVLQQRAAYSHAVIDGRAVHEYEPQGKAAEEMASLYKDLMPYITTQTAKRKKSA
jgi:chromosome partitioning protein